MCFKRAEKNGKISAYSGRAVGTVGAVDCSLNMFFLCVHLTALKACVKRKKK